ncbi:MAG TPA: ATP-binding protein, partial [Paenibacillus sp.]|nr:ATP-binding protein [Paenibacillus sp.]
RGILDGVARSPEKLEHYAQIIYTNANAMEKLIEELFLYSKLDLDQVPMQLERIDVRNYVADYVEELQFSLEPSGVRLRCSAPPGSVTDAYIVLADRDQLRRVVDNIVQNSLKYMDKPEPSIEVRLHAGEDVVTVEIEDNGIGIASESLPYIFDSFYRADAARSSATGGSGLGMAIARRIVEAHGGRIWAESEPGAGTTISFRLNKPGRGGDAQHAEHIDH